MSTQDFYKCSKCGIKNVKLWRKAQSFSIDLMCGRCCAEFYNVDISNIDRDGKYTWFIEKNVSKTKTVCAPGRTDHIGSHVPAIPFSEEIESYWASFSAPEVAIERWRGMKN